MPPAAPAPTGHVLPQRAPQADASTEMPAQATTAATAKAAADAGDAAPAASMPYALPPVVVPGPLTATQKHALAAGLHPDLSRDLLERLSATDYRNASVVIGAALAGKPAPRGATARTASAAAFSVHFVEGGAEGCRRFVVTIAKAGWETTAPPMESCGGRFVPVRG